MEKLPNIHPGEILNEEFLGPFNITAYKLSKEIRISQTRISQIIKGKRRITADTALSASLNFLFAFISHLSPNILFFFGFILNSLSNGKTRRGYK